MMRDWQTSTLDDVCSVITDGAHNSPPSVKVGLPMASVKDLTPYGITIETCRLITGEDFEKLMRQGCKPEVGDVLIAKDGASALDTVCEVKKPINLVLLSSVAILRPDVTKVTPGYLRYYLESPNTRTYMKNSFISGAAIPRVVLKDFKRAKILVPPLPIQRKIASILSAYDDLIENNTRRIQILEEMARDLYREWFVNFRFPGHEKVKMVESELGEIPEGWEEKSVAEVCEFVSRGVTPDYQEKSGKFIINQKVNRGARLALENLKELNLDLIVPEDKYARKFDVLVNSLGEGTIGRVHLFRGPDKLWAVDQHMTILRSSNTANTLFLYMKLSSDEGQSKIESVKTGATNMTMLNISVLRNMTFLFPDQGLLKTFFKRVEPIYNLISYLENKNLNLAKTRVLLLPKLISGELDVSELDITTEELKP